ncbi:hypothetical protein [Bacillus solimangrovi]|uniref:EfeO-type cupredoxin-like domain-containing protein n=1 Tax=Bacillus solimangrovi TaxID=1305675 RepID=A0A1E5LF44_9BACI|nr:hypothetical protein [Bacillus solimangrovi]OEH92697.1 hypothetical protein BFG57_01445 [Bacillus solimangrovi]
MKKYVVRVATLLITASILAACSTNDNLKEGSNKEENVPIQNTNNELNITGVNWSFDQDTYTIPANEDVTINYTDEEGIHGIKIRPFGEEQKKNVFVEVFDGESGIVNLEPGEYEIHCATKCGGKEHKLMYSTLIVE